MKKIENDPFYVAGIILVVAGILDIIVMALCTANRISHSSNLWILSIIGGLYLLRRGAKAAKNIRSASAFILAATCSISVAYPILIPYRVAVEQVSNSDLSSWIYAALALSTIGFVYSILSSERSNLLLESEGFSARVPYRSVTLGIGLVFVVSVAIYLVQNGSVATKAKQIAHAQLGDKYSYHVTKIFTSDSERVGSAAVVVAYNESELKQINVHW